MAQRRTPTHIRENLPADPEARRKEYHRRYAQWWHSQRPAYAKTKSRQYRERYGKDRVAK